MAVKRTRPGIRQMLKNHDRHKKIIEYIVVLCFFVAGITAYTFITTAHSMGNETFCEKEEHIHDETCYDQQDILICEKEEHSHVLACYSNPDADKENTEEWENSAASLCNSGDVKTDLVIFASAQLGYKESENNYLVDDDDQMHGYSRYGDFAGDPYGDWNTAFPYFCMSFARMDLSKMPYEADPVSWSNALKKAGSFLPRQRYAPEEGDVVFFKQNDELLCGILSGINEEGIFLVIAGDRNGGVAEERLEEKDIIGSYVTEHTPTGMQTAPGPLGGELERLSVTWMHDSDYTDIDSNNDLVMTPNYNSIETYARARFDFSLDDAFYDIGDIELTLPYHMLKDREGNWTDTFSSGVPTAADPGVSEFSYVVDETNNKVVITNCVQLNKAVLGNGYFSYYFLPSDVEDMSAGTGTVTLRYKKNGSWTDYYEKDITISEVNTSVADFVMNQSGHERHFNWESEWGTAPANAEDYFYVQFGFYSRIDASTGTQPFDLTYTVDDIDDGELVYFAYADHEVNQLNNTYLGSHGLSGTGHTIAELEALSVHYDAFVQDNSTLSFIGDHFDIVVKYPKSSYVDGASFTAQMSVYQTPSDGIDAPNSGTITNTYKVLSNKFNYSEGFQLYKYGDNQDGVLAYETERMSSSSYNKSGVIDTGPLTLLRNGLPTYLRYRIDSNVSSGAILYEDKTLNRFYDWSFDMADDQLFLEGEQLLPGDYEIVDLYLGGSVQFSEYIEEDGGWIFESNRSYSLSSEFFPQYSVWYKTNPSGEWIKNTGKITTSALISLPSGAVQVKFRYDSSAADIPNKKILTSNTNYFVKIKLLPSEHVLSLIEGKDEAYFTNVCTGILYGPNGEIKSQYSSDSISGRYKDTICANDIAAYGDLLDPGYVLPHKSQTDILGGIDFYGKITKSAATPVEEASNQRVRIDYTIQPSGSKLGFSVGLDVDTANAIHNGTISVSDYARDLISGTSIHLDDFTYYDLLPFGLTVDIDSIVVNTAKDATNLITDLQIVDNWRNTGRTMIIARVDASSAVTGSLSGYYPGGFSYRGSFDINVPIRLKYSGYYSWEAMRDYGTSLHNVVALKDNTDKGFDFLNAYPDDTSSLSSSVMNASEKAAMDDLDGLTDTNKNTFYAASTTSVNPQTFSVSGFEKTVKSEEEYQFTKSSIALVGGTYTYRFRYSNSDYQQTKGMIIYDVLENAYGTNSYWKGTLERLDLSSLTKLGIAPVVYYSTKDGIVIGTNEPDNDLSDTSVWSTTPPADLADVTAFAVDARKKTNNTDFILKEGEAISILAFMRAPSDATGLIDPQILAYNDAQLYGETRTTTDQTSVFAPKFGFAEPATVALKNDFRFHIIKTDKQGSPIKGVTFELYDSDEELFAQSVTLTDGTASFKGLKINQEYTLIESSVPNGYSSAGPWTVGVQEDGTVTVKEKVSTIQAVLNNKTFTITRKDDNGAVVSGATLKLTDTSGNLISTQTTSSNGTASFTVTDLTKAYILTETSSPSGKITKGPWLIEQVNGTVNISVKKQGDDFHIVNYPKMVTVLKVDDKGTPLSGGKFALYGTDGSGNKLSSPLSGYDELISDENGVVADLDVPAGTYYLEEIQAPEGFTKVSAPIKVVIAGDKTVTITLAEGHSGDAVCENGQIKVINTGLYELPATGGEGVALFYIFGTLMVCTAMVLGSIFRKKNS